MLDTSRFDIPRFLTRLPLFGDLDTPEIERIAAGCTLRRLERGDMVFRVGEPCEHFHVVVMGQVKLFVISPGGQEKVIELVGQGQSFAEALVFLGRPCLVNAQTLADSLLLTVQRARPSSPRSGATTASRCACSPACRAGCTGWCTTCRPTRCRTACSA